MNHSTILAQYCIYSVKASSATLQKVTDTSVQLPKLLQNDRICSSQFAWDCNCEYCVSWSSILGHQAQFMYYFQMQFMLNNISFIQIKFSYKHSCSLELWITFLGK